LTIAWAGATELEEACGKQEVLIIAIVWYRNTGMTLLDGGQIGNTKVTSLLYSAAI